MKAIKRIGATYMIPDGDLDGAQDSLQIIEHYFQQAFHGLQAKAEGEGREVDWTTLNMRIFRDVDVVDENDEPLDESRRHDYLTLRVVALTKAGEIR